MALTQAAPFTRDMVLARSESEDMDEARQNRVSFLFLDTFDTYMEYRRNLIARSETWRVSEFGRRRSQEAIAEGAARLFPPSAFCQILAASSHWQLRYPSANNLVVVSCGGVFGGADGPSGLFQYVGGVLADTAAFLYLDTGHSVDVAVEVLRAALRWLLSHHPEYIGRVVLAGFSMGSSTVTAIGAEFLSAIRGIIIVAGQTAGTEALRRFAGKQVLLIHGQEDPNVSVACSRDLADTAHLAGAGVDLHIFPQRPYRCLGDADSDLDERFLRHHLWEERWDVQAVVLDWLRARIREVARAVPQHAYF